MRFRNKPKLPPSRPPLVKDETRVVSRFLWLPRRIGDETRWLERATIRQLAVEVLVGNVGGYTLRELAWKDEAWVNSEPDKLSGFVLPSTPAPKPPPREPSEDGNHPLKAAAKNKRASMFEPLHPQRLLVTPGDPTALTLEGVLRQQWVKWLECRPDFDLLSGPEVSYNDIPPGVEADLNTLTGQYQPYPHGRMTPRDWMVTAEFVQWLGSPIGLAFLTTAFQRAGGRVEYSDYNRKEVSVES